jgi:hypothetical protein
MRFEVVKAQKIFRTIRKNISRKARNDFASSDFSNVGDDLQDGRAQIDAHDACVGVHFVNRQISSAKNSLSRSDSVAAENLQRGMCFDCKT